MTRKSRYSLLAALVVMAAVGSCQGGGQRRLTDEQVTDLERRVKDLEDSVSGTGKKLKKYFKHTGPDVDAPSFYEYVDSLALLVCELREKEQQPPPPYGICKSPERLEKTPPPTYPPR